MYDTRMYPCSLFSNFQVTWQVVVLHPVSSRTLQWLTWHQSSPSPGHLSSWKCTRKKLKLKLWRCPFYQQTTILESELQRASHEYGRNKRIWFRKTIWNLIGFETTCENYPNDNINDYLISFFTCSTMEPQICSFNQSFSAPYVFHTSVLDLLFILNDLPYF